MYQLIKQKDNEKIIREYAERLEDKVEERTLELQKEMELKAMAQKALQESQKLYVTIAENYPNGSITVLDEDYHVVFAEGSEFKSAELKATEVIGKNYFDFVPNEYKEEIENYLIEVFKGTEKIFEYEKEGKINRARCVPLSYENYKVDQILIVENNVTQEKRAEKEIYAALTKEKQLNELKTKFVSMASHEFRTPLSSILSSATLVGKYTESSQQDNRLKHLKKISKNVKNLTMILNDFLSLERIEGGLIKNNPEEIDISEFMEGVAEDAEPLLKKDQVIQLDIRVKNNIILLDIFLLRNILNNLITNAIKYSSDTITLIVEDTNGLTISVKDSGIGISEEDQVSLFNRFYRASNAGQIQGTGLGLNIVKRYVNIMGGQIIFESKLNKGSTFSIKFNE